MMVQTHPERALLREFAAGRLDAARSSELESHLEICTACCRKLRDADTVSDRFVDELVAAVKSDAVPSTTKSALLPRNVGRFEIRALAGEGGFGIVMSAFDPKLRREVAIKIPRPGMVMTPELQQRFSREARAVAALEHANIVPVYDTGEENGVWYIASAFCDGPTLADWLRGHPQPVGFDDTAQTIAEIAAGVAHAHARRVLHRDLKPSNVLLEPRSEAVPDHAPLRDFVPRITDFGLAKLESDKGQQTRTHLVMGTARYMAPEQARGHSREVGPPADVYALGAMLYELVTRRPPLEGDGDLETLSRLQVEEPIPPSRLRPKTPRDLETICLNCLRKDPRRRYQSADALRGDLECYLRGDAIEARRQGFVERAGRWCRRRPAVAALTFAVALLLATLLLGSMASAIWLNEERNKTLEQLRRTEEANAATRRAELSARDQERRAKRQLLKTLVAEANASRTSGQRGQRFESLAAIRQAADFAKEIGIDRETTLALRNAFIAASALDDLRPERSWPSFPPNASISGVAFDAELQRYARVVSGGDIVIRDLSTNTDLTRITGTGAPPHGPDDWRLYLRFSPDGRYVAARGWTYWTFPTRVWDVRSKALLIELKPESVGGRLDQDFSPDSRCYAVARQDRSISVLETKSSRELARIHVGASPSCLRFHPNEPFLAICHGSKLQVVDWKTGEPVHDWDVPGTIETATWHPDGKMLAIGCADTHVYLWEPGAEEKPRVLRGHQGGVIGVSFDSTGDRLATASYDGSTIIWHVATAEPLVRADGYAASFSRDGTRLAFGYSGTDVGYWHLSENRAFRLLSTRPIIGERNAFEIGPAARLATSVAEDGIVLSDLVSGQELTLLPTGPQSKARIHPSGEAIVTCSAFGAFRWPVQRDWRRRIIVGPSETISLPSGSIAYDCEFAPLGEWLVITTQGKAAGVYTFKWPNIRQAASQFADPQAWGLGISDDGQWVAAVSFHGLHGTIRKLHSANDPLSIIAPRGRFAFRPNSDSLVAASPDAFRFYRMGSETPLREIRHPQGSGCAVDFTADGKLLALLHESHSVKLYDSESMVELATFESPLSEPMLDAHLSADGARLVAATGSGSVHDWDVTALRESLAELDLNWDGPARETDADVRVAIEQIDLLFADDYWEHWHRQARAKAKAGKHEAAFDDLSKAIEFAPRVPAKVYYDRGWIALKIERTQQGIDDYFKAITAEPDNPHYCNELAWILAICSDVELRDSQRAVQLARRATELDPRSGPNWNTLGVANYRGGDWAAALEALEESMRLKGGGESWDWFFVAMCHWQEGRTDEAIRWREKALDWMTENAPNNEELVMFREEAADLVKDNR